MLKDPEELFKESLLSLTAVGPGVYNRVSATTCIGLVNQAGVVVAADSRASAMTGQIISESFNKIVELDNHSVIAISGAVSIAQKIIKFLRARFSYEADLYEGQTIPAETKCNLIKNTIGQFVSFNGSPKNQVFISPIFATWDLNQSEPGGRIFKILPDLSLTPETQVEAIGSGSVVALPVLETLLGVVNKLPSQNNLEKVLGYKEAVYFAVVSLLASSAKDSHTGENIRVVLVSKKGIEKIDQEEIGSIIASVKRGEVLPR